ncbi:hypothetical protein Nepgr_030007 [Nepenthes gracilis]|uniref:Uncharacterized protein n=1 Tax=Nepenthes gracilis TaxID=150966 RepID=A0AAD3TFE4_NEPGR|nr:hypothetical protein Nepgr_030007 [Nepenthes gracilis]
MPPTGHGRGPFGGIRTMDYGPYVGLKALPPARSIMRGYGFRLWGSTQPVLDVVAPVRSLKMITNLNDFDEFFEEDKMKRIRMKKKRYDDFSYAMLYYEFMF